LKIQPYGTPEGQRPPLKALKTAIDILQNRKKHPPLIFPEGDVYHMNGRITAFRDGAAAIALLAARRLSASLMSASESRYGRQGKQTLIPAPSELTDLLEQRVQSMLDELNAQRKPRSSESPRR